MAGPGPRGAGASSASPPRSSPSPRRSPSTPRTCPPAILPPAGHRVPPRPWPDEQQLTAPSPFGDVDRHGVGRGCHRRCPVGRPGHPCRRHRQRGRQRPGHGARPARPAQGGQGQAGRAARAERARARRPRGPAGGRGRVDGTAEPQADGATADGHAGIHVATDIDRSRSNNAPVGVDRGCAAVRRQRGHLLGDVRDDDRPDAAARQRPLPRLVQRQGPLRRCLGSTGRARRPGPSGGGR